MLFKIEIFHGMIHDFLKLHPSTELDVITLLNVLEHLTNPVETMEQLGRVLAPDGIVAIVVPDARFHDIVGRRPVRWWESPTLTGWKTLPFLPGFVSQIIFVRSNREQFRQYCGEQATKS